MKKMLKNIEFYMLPYGDVEVRNENSTFVLIENNFIFINAMLELISVRYTKAYDGLKERYQKYARNKMHYNFLLVRGFIKCNMNMYDNLYDIDENGNLKFEYIPCPMTGECPWYKIICQPEEITEISVAEERVLSLIAEGKQQDEIAEILCISRKTVENHTNNMLRKIGHHNNAALTTYYHQHVKNNSKRRVN